MDEANRYIREGFGIDDALDELESVLNDFGASMSAGVDDYLKEVMDKEETWAKEIERWWKETAPYETTNLRQAISIDGSKMPKEVVVGVDVDKLLARAGQKIKGVRTGRVQKIPDYDYTEDADQYNVSAAYIPYGSREHIPFIRQVWFAYAQRAREEVFG